MNSVFIILLRFPDYFEVHLAPTARETVESRGEDPVISRAFAAGDRQLQRYKIREGETSERLSGKFCIYKQRILLTRFY